MLHSLSLLAFLLLARESQCWGPYTHAAFGSLYFDRHDNSGASLESGNRLRGKQLVDNNNSSFLESVFVVANAFPDAFKETRDWMHTFDYAAFQLEQSVLWTKTNGSQPASWKTSFDFVHTDSVKAYAFGYMLHLLEDYVGHHRQGYLNPTKDHLLELDVDTLFYLLHKNNGAPWQYRYHGMQIIENQPEVMNDISPFVAQTSQQYAKRNIDNGTTNKTDHSGLTLVQVKNCIRQFSSLLRMEEYVMTANAMVYKHGMVKYDFCHAATLESANATLNRAIGWTEATLGVFESHFFPFQVASHRNDYAEIPGTSQSKALRASRVARDWVETTYKSHGGTICGGLDPLTKSDGEILTIKEYISGWILRAAQQIFKEAPQRG